MKNFDLKEWAASEEAIQQIAEAVASAEVRALKKRKARRVSRKTALEPCTI